MPTGTLSRSRIAELLPPEWSQASWNDLLFASKAELESAEGDDLSLAVTPDRIDLLSEGGLALALQGEIGSRTGLPRPRPLPATEPVPTIEVDASVAPLRPAIAGAVVQAPDDRGLDAGLLAEAVRFQELLHATIGRDRRVASLGIYPIDRLSPPVRYTLEPLDGVRFVPLDGTEEIGANRFFEDHPMAVRYGAFGRSGSQCLTLRDSSGTILSLPPILNGRTAGEARGGDRYLLLESTGTRERSVREALGLLLLPFAARGWSVGAVPVVGPGDHRSDGRAVIDPHSIDLPSAVVRSIAGTPLTSAEVEHRLARSRLGSHPQPGGWRVEAPPWRPDVMTAVDAVEDIVLATGVRPEDGIVPPSRTRGRILPSVRLRRRVAGWLLGLGFAQPNTPLLLSEAAVARLGGRPPIRLHNPVSAEFAYVRDRLLPSHLHVLGRNTRHGYPQRFGEIGPVVVPDPAAEPGADTRYHAGVLIAADTAGFADAAAVIDYLLRGLDVSAVREPAELPATIPGRAAVVRVAGEPVAEVGEIHPQVLADLGVPVPVAWAEVDLTALGPLVRRRDRD